MLQNPIHLRLERLESWQHVTFMACLCERMYPNYVGSEAVLASENLYFEQKHCDLEGFELTMHPFSRNTIGSMDWGGVVMKHRMGQGTDNGNFYHDTSSCSISISPRCSKVALTMALFF